ncbi:hypothetical protein [Yeosuana sp. AK3]
MKTIKCITNTLIVAVFSICMLSAQNNEKALLNVTEITVKQGHNSQFVEGVKKWKECYLENKGTNKWNFWKRVQGEGNVYVMTGFMNTWAEMDKEDTAGDACYLTLVNFIMPHVEKVNYNITQTMPEFSKGPSEDTKLVWVTFYRVKNDVDFKEIISAVSGAIKAKEGSPRAWWYSYMGGAVDAPDYMVSTPYKSFADLDITRDSPGKVYEDAVGKEKADEMRAKWRAAVSDSWSHIYTLNSEISHQTSN